MVGDAAGDHVELAADRIQGDRIQAGYRIQHCKVRNTGIWAYPGISSHPIKDRARGVPPGVQSPLRRPALPWTPWALGPGRTLVFILAPSHHSIMPVSLCRTKTSDNQHIVPYYFFLGMLLPLLDRELSSTIRHG